MHKCDTHTDELRNKIAAVSIMSAGTTMPPPRVPQQIVGMLPSIDSEHFNATPSAIQSNSSNTPNLLARLSPVMPVTTETGLTEPSFARAIIDPKTKSTPKSTAVAEMVDRPSFSSFNANSQPDLITAGWGEDIFSKDHTASASVKVADSNQVDIMDRFTDKSSGRFTGNNAPQTFVSRFFPTDSESVECTENFQSPKPIENSFLSQSHRQKVKPIKSPEKKILKFGIADEQSKFRLELKPPSPSGGWVEGHGTQSNASTAVSHIAAKSSLLESTCKIFSSLHATSNAYDSKIEKDVEIPGSPVVEEREMLLKNNVIDIMPRSSSDEGSSSAKSVLRNMKRFKKNKVRGVFEPPVDGLLSAGSLAPRPPLYSVHDMDKVLPKESERELQVCFEEHKIISNVM